MPAGNRLGDGLGIYNPVIHCVNRICDWVWSFIRVSYEAVRAIAGLSKSSLINDVSAIYMTLVWTDSEFAKKHHCPETQMPPQTDSEYDAIAGAYNDSMQLSFRKYIEEYTLFETPGDIDGVTALDLACGEGFYTRS